MSAGGGGDLAIVLHSHMPYVEGFGTYPFGEEWLFDAVACSDLPVLEAAERLTVTVTPVLADQLEAAGVGERMLEFLERHLLGAAERTRPRPSPAATARPPTPRAPARDPACGSWTGTPCAPSRRRAAGSS